LNLENAKKIDGWTFESELATLAKLAEDKENIVEVGSWKGRSTRAICDNTKATVYAVDHWKGPEDFERWSYDYQEVILIGSNGVFNIFKDNLREYVDSGKLIPIKKSSVQGAKYLTKAFGEEYFDMVYIDADHTYEHAKEDIGLYLPLIKKGGIISGHDFNWEGVHNAVCELLPDCKTEGNIWYKIV